MKLIYILLFAFCVFQAGAQTLQIKGRVKDGQNNSLQAASVLLLQSRDSVMVSFATTDAKGLFSLAAEKNGSYLIQVNFLGFKTGWKAVQTKDSGISLEDILLEDQQTTLPSIEISAEQDLMKIGRDTVEFNAGAFKTQPGAVVEDLLKKLPGVEVQRDGSIRAFGENVQNVLVDGKEFFGRDTRMATKNLEADAVDKVQVFDKKSDMAEFTGVADGRDEKTINLSLKADRKNGHFGNAELAGGSDGRFKTKVNLNRFSPGSRLSLIGLGNNINDQSFSFQEYLDFMGGLGAFMSGGRGRLEINQAGSLPVGGGPVQGVQQSLAGGINFSRDFSAKTSFTASYLANNFKNRLDRNSDRQSLLSDAFYNSLENENQYSRNTGHNITFRLKSKLDSFQNLIINGGGNWGDSRFESLLANSTFLQDYSEVNSSDRKYEADGTRFNFNTSVTWQKRFRKAGRSFVVSASGRYGDNDRQGRLDALNQYFQFGTQADSLLQNQVFEDRNGLMDSRMSYTEPLGRKRFIELNGYWSNARNRTNNDYFDIVDPFREIRNELLSARYNRGYRVYSAGLKYIKNHNKYYLSYGLNLQHSQLNGKIQDLEQTISSGFTRLLPNASLQYELGTAHHLNLEYETRLQEPSLEQLQPVPDNTDPLNIYIGNPGLRPEYVHRMNSSYFKYDQFSFTSVFASLGGQYTRNRITDLIEIDSLFRRTIRPVNVKYEKALQGNLEFSTPVRPLKISTRLRLRAQLAQSLLYVNELENRVNRAGTSVYWSVENRKKDFFDAQAGVRYSRNNTAYSISKDLDQVYKETNLFGELTLIPSSQWSIKSEFDYLSYNQPGRTGRVEVPLWQASLTRFFTKQQRLKVSLSVFDILNKNQGISRSSELNYLEVQRTNVLGRYFMLGLAYSIKGFKKSGGGIEINIGED
ncbi:MAG TPA: outer membrane beta-barrel protein [Saprospiraceae bacterium]|nr:outer membrane beta-barrel protein [Saprospiraceae bacterium]HNT20994.1 outer membrane beta-barrel protein [Saprospiraceae bacterium]